MHGLDELPVTDLPKVGPSVEKTLEKLNIRSVLDLLFHLPFRYEDRAHLWPLSSINRGDTVQGQGRVVASQINFGKRRSLEVIVEDASGRITLRFYYFNAAQQKQFTAGNEVRFFGDVRLGRNGLEMYHPEYQVKKGEEWPELSEALTPVYPLTEGISQNRLRGLIREALKRLPKHPPREYLFQRTCQKYGFPPIEGALRLLHEPGLEINLSRLLSGTHPAQSRFIYEELLAHHFSLLRMRHSVKAHRAHTIAAHYGSESFTTGATTQHLFYQLLSELPFSLTRAQQRVINEILSDLVLPHPMMRLVQGDVGSGKTIVAALSALAVIDSGFQVAVMAPTEILAEQHRINFENWFRPLGISVGWLSGKTGAKARRELMADVGERRISLVVGTHALFQDDVHFDSLALVIVDEQHRFGVHQRLALKEKGQAGFVPHQLIMTATPIPRTLAMSAYADLDTSVIDELPPGRKEIVTAVVSDQKRNEVIERVRLACQEGRQAYWVCTLIEESEVLQCQAAESTFDALVAQLPELNVGLIHGRLKSADKARVMDQFKEGVLDLLVATTVIEVGVDVPNATLMIIENPERLGLAQLHQLRGRVGRGDQDSYCLLMYSTPLSENGRARLKAMRESNSGFVIAEKDLEIRGPGELLGTRQTGLMSFKMADLQRDKCWLEAVREDATEYADKPGAIQGMMQRWIGSRIMYADV